MNALKNFEDPRQETASVARQLAEREASLETMSDETKAGDVYLLFDSREDGVEWLLVDERNRRWLALAVDEHPLAGSHDLALPLETLGGEAVVRCDVDAWLGSEQLKQATRTARLSEVDLARVRRKLREVQSGKVAASLVEEEVESDFAYQRWIATLKRERDVLASRSEPASSTTVEVPPVASKARSWWQPLAMAATVILAVFLGWQTQQLQQSLDHERDRLAHERDRLAQVEAERTAERRELEASLAEAEQRATEARELGEQVRNENARQQERIAALESSLEDALETRIQVNIPQIELSASDRTSRLGYPLVYRFEKGQRSALLALAVTDPEPYDRYRLRFIDEEGKVRYENDQMQKKNGQWLRLDLPAGFLPAGKYHLVVHGIRDGELTEIEDAADQIRLVYPE